MSPAAVMQKWVEGTVAGQTRWTERLFSLKVEADIPFEAGQFAKLALEVEGEMLARPYSFVNAPGERPNEFYYVTLPEGPLTQRLCRLQAGDKVHLAPRPAGFLALSEVPDGENLWLLSTGTGIGPFLSILKTEAPWRRFRQVVLVHAVRYAPELNYRETIERLAREHGEQMRAVSFVSREAAPGALPGRVPAAVEEGRLEAAAGVVLSAGKSQVMICGNPEMVSDTSAALARRGMKKHRRRDPGQITVENYW
ncbi:MAG TPA: ferredoxin--NADP reductase [Burkholderiales bacterium]|nr:ferredoxin--NADP reductase [Burkholderiales bacterium]